MSFPALVEPAAELTIDEVRRYSRHLISPDVGMTGQKRLKNAKVLVIGAGGLVWRRIVARFVERSGSTEIVTTDHDILDGIALSQIA